VKVIRTYKDLYNRENKFQHRKPLRGSTESRHQNDCIMKITDINDFLKSVISLSFFRTIIAKEVMDYKQQLQKKGSNVSITLNEGSDIKIDASDVVFLCQHFLNHEMSEYELCYLIDALLLSSRVFFSDEDTKELIELLTDPEINGEFTNERITALMHSALRLTSYIQS
jgi:hypothetical protein